MTNRIHTQLNKVRAVSQVDGPLSAAYKIERRPIESIKARNDCWRYAASYPIHLIFIAGLPKSGSTWVANMVSSLPGFIDKKPAHWAAAMLTTYSQDLNERSFDEFRKKLVVVKGHTRGTLENAIALENFGRPYLVTIRDPRDQLISSYWYLRNRPRHPRHHHAANVDLETYLTEQLLGEDFNARTLDWIRLWMKNRSYQLSHVLRYDDTLSSPEIELRAALRHLGIEISRERLSQIVLANSFGELAGRPRGTQDTSSFLRRGESGEWREVFSKSHKRRFKEIGEDVIEMGSWMPTT